MQIPNFYGQKHLPKMLKLLFQKKKKWNIKLTLKRFNLKFINLSRSQKKTITIIMLKAIAFKPINYFILILICSNYCFPH